VVRQEFKLEHHVSHYDQICRCWILCQGRFLVGLIDIYFCGYALPHHCLENSMWIFSSQKTKTLAANSVFQVKLDFFITRLANRVHNRNTQLVVIVWISLNAVSPGRGQIKCAWVEIQHIIHLIALTMKIPWKFVYVDSP